jgi:glycerol-3-phosphate dehydrogenase (NAD(P)+)
MIGIVGAGAFGTALAVALARDGRNVTLWARDTEPLLRTRQSAYLPGAVLPETVTITAKLADLTATDCALLAIPTQALQAFLSGPGQPLASTPLVACCKGVDLSTLVGPTALIAKAFPGATPSLLTGPSFAADIARGLPTALTLACGDDGLGERLQTLLSTTTLRLYRTDDVTGAELGGALKNVIAIAAGIAIGAGLGESARAALITRGYAEMVRLATALHARPETLAGLSGFGDLVLTCTSDQSRNFRFGRALGSGQAFDPSATVEGMATARAVARLATQRGIDLPLTSMVAALIDGQIDLPIAIQTLLSRPLRKE